MTLDFHLALTVDTLSSSIFVGVGGLESAMENINLFQHNSQIWFICPLFGLN